MLMYKPLEKMLMICPNDALYGKSSPIFSKDGR